MPLAGEAAILDLVDRHFPNAGEGFSLGRGDDCAIFERGAPVAVSSDLFLEDSHFRRSYFTPGEIGHKALAVNLSDLAACAAKPLAFSLSLGLPASLGMDWLEAMLAGMAQLADKFGVFLCGGDISRSDKIQIAITIFGEQAQDGCLLRRGGAKAGDAIFLIGPIGLAALALRQLERAGREHCGRLYPQSLRAHVRPMPLVETGLQLGRLAKRHGNISLMDVSDGIARDLPRLLGPGLGAELALDCLHPELEKQKRLENIDPAAFAIQGGEDYALLGACAPNLLEILRQEAPALQVLGKVVEKATFTCNGQLIGGGFDHFE